jgi:hypothetical protein
MKKQSIPILQGFILNNTGEISCNNGLLNIKIKLMPIKIWEDKDKAFVLGTFIIQKFSKDFYLFQKLFNEFNINFELLGFQIIYKNKKEFYGYHLINGYFKSISDDISQEGIVIYDIIFQKYLLF